MKYITALVNNITRYKIDTKLSNNIADRKVKAIRANKRRNIKPRSYMVMLAFMLSSMSLASNMTYAATPDNTVSDTSLNHDIHPAIAAKKDIAISNYPLFLISEAVTKGAPSGHLLLDAGDIGHHGSLSPSDMKTIEDSRYVVWFGEALETNLVNTMNDHNNTIALFDMQAFERHPLRDTKGQNIDQTLDPHIWLDPNNAKAIARALGTLYSRANPENRALYSQNVKDFSARMNEAVLSIQQSIPYRTTRPYWAYHDALQYIESTLNIELAGSLTTDHHLPPKATQFRWLQQHRPNPTMCIALQSDSNQGVVSKLEPVTTIVTQEDMSNSKDFVSGWIKIANSLLSCTIQEG